MTLNRNIEGRSSMSRSYVLDAWALLALLQGEEPAAGRVRQILVEGSQRQADLLVSMVNLGEAYYRIGRRKGRAIAAQTLTEMRSLPLTVVAASDDMILDAADLKMEYAISYADAFAAALATRTGATLVSGDPDFIQLANRIKLERLHRAK